MLQEAGSILGFVLRHPVGRRRPLRCLAATLWWQATASKLAKPVKFVGTTRLWARRGETGVTGNIYVGLHEFADMAFVAHALRPGDLFLDVGANAGSYTVLAGAVAGAEVIAVEPVPETAARLRANIVLNGIGERVRVVEAALGAEPGEVFVSTGRDTTNRIVADAGDGPAVRVPLTTIDRLCADHPPFLVKIDVEGFDAEVTAGARKVLADRRVAAVIVETDAGLNGPDSSAGQLIDLGFDPAVYEPFARRLSSGSTGCRSGNVLFVRDFDLVRARLADAPAIEVKGLPI